MERKHIFKIITKCNFPTKCAFLCVRTKNMGIKMLTTRTIVKYNGYLTMSYCDDFDLVMICMF